MIINHKGTRMVKQTTNSKNLGLLTFRDAQIVGILSPIKLLFGPLVIQLVWYILKQLFPNFQNCVRCEKDLKDNKDNSRHLGWKYARVFVLGHNLFLVAHSFPRATLLENCSLLRTDNVRRQISEHIFAPNGDYCLFIIHPLIFEYHVMTPASLFVLRLFPLRRDIVSTRILTFHLTWKEAKLVLLSLAIGIIKSWWQVLFRKVQKGHQNMLSMSLKVKKVTSRLLIFSPRQI